MALSFLSGICSYAIFDQNELHRHLAIGLVAGLAIIAILLFAEVLGRKAIVLAKEQDRKYFLHSIREAKNIFELECAGLFYNLNKYTDWGSKLYSPTVACESVAMATQELRDAIYGGDYPDYIP